MLGDTLAWAGGAGPGGWGILAGVVLAQVTPASLPGGRCPWRFRGPLTVHKEHQHWRSP
ncbi:hypothetical protein A4R44_07297 [Amycolatopsis sp. M39]|uniref:Uncharacterized protein n=1 Tax=Amycolatopsis rubida TaxID=112413 RepID=A0A1I5KH32_9PSEU|nr:hypothetical protein A4R44_07297 [Amycolatopsis sp. M39]SFO84339.1 hypothetical protein SAMN05421854_103189 [Amycolatopsis rubida]